MYFKCDSCEYSNKLFIKLMTHYRNEHFFEPNFKLKCLFSDLCIKPFNSVDYFLKHARKNHSDLYKKVKDPQKYANEIKETLNEINRDPNNLIDLSNNKDDFIEEMNDEDSEQMKSKDYLLNIALSAVHKYKVNKMACNFFMTQLAYISDKSFELGMRAKSENNYNYVKSQCSYLSNSIAINNIVQSMPLHVKPVSCKLLLQPNRPILKTYQYVPICKTLKMILESKFGCKFIKFAEEKSISGLFKDYKDGSLCHSNELFKDVSSLKIQLYIDDFGVANPLRNRARRSKMTAIYMQLLNIPPEYRSSLHFIFLVCLFPTHYLNYYTYEEICEPLIKDLLALEADGIEINHGDSKKVTHRGSVAMVVADNLASQGFSGFLGSSANRFCRKCMAVRNDKKKADLEGISMRTARSYDMQILFLKEDASVTSLYGIKKEFPLHALKFYHCIGGLPPDIYHDLFEGTVGHILEPMFEKFLEYGYISKQQLQNDIVNFKYMASDKTDKPTDISLIDNLKPKLTAIQHWCLCRLLPLIIGHRIPIGNPYWNMFLLLRKILDFVMAQEIKDWQIVELKITIIEFAEEYLRLVSNVIKPKLHYLLHYAEETFQFGPLIHSSTIRYEAKHQYFKDLYVKTKNHVNPALSMANQHQEYMTFTWSNMSINESCDFQLFNVHVLVNCPNDIDLLNKVKQSFVNSGIVIENDFILISNKIASKSSSRFVIEAGNAFPVTSNQCFITQFAVIDLFCRLHIGVEKKIFAICKIINTIHFDDHFYAYHVESPYQSSFSIYRALSTDNAKVWQVLGCYKIEEKWYISLKRIIASELNLLGLENQ